MERYMTEKIRNVGDRSMIGIEKRTCPSCEQPFDLNLIEEVADGIDTIECSNCKAVLDAFYD
jgi:predicted  nucleic acid-binding Zn ribbon protein